MTRDDKHSMLASIALFTASLPLALVVERVILRFTGAPIATWLQVDLEAPRSLPWQTPRWRETVARALAFTLPVLLLLAAIRFETPDIFVAAVVVLALVTCCATDLLAYRVPNLVTLPALSAVLLVSAASGLPELAGALAGAAVCGGAMLVMAVVTRGGLGGGDVKLVALIGAALGLPEAPIALGAGIVAGSLVVIALHATRTLKRGDVFPYAPFLSIAALVVLFL